jgi:pyridoxine kinase
MADAQRAVLKLQETVPAVVLTSFSLPQQPDGNINDDDHDNQCLYLMGCCRGSSGCFTIKFPRRHGYFTGTGDLFAALLLAHYHYECLLNNGNNGIALAKACEIAVEIMQSVLELTCSKYNSNDIGNTNDKSRQVKGMELRLIESRHLFQRTANGGGVDANSGGVAEMKAQVINYLIK